MTDNLLLSEGSEPTPKDSLRKHMRALLAELTLGEHVKFSEEAAQHLTRSRLWQEAKTVYLFVSMGREIRTDYLLEEAWKTGKTVCLPKCRSDQAGMMDFWPCSGLGELSPGPYGILEPTNPVGTPNPEPDLVLLPALACTRKGHRVGYGGGYYDKFFADHLFPKAVRVGFCFSFQVVTLIPHDPWDLPVHDLCTNSGLYMISEPAGRDVP